MVTQYWDQHTSDIWNKADIDNLMNGIRGNGVISGGAVSATGVSLTLSYTAMVVRAGGVEQSLAAGTINASGGHATLPRYDLVIYDDSANAVAMVEGTPTAESSSQPRPPEPDLPDVNDLILAKIYVPAAATVILGANVFNRRTFPLEDADVYDLMRARLRASRYRVAEFSGATIGTGDSDGTAALQGEIVAQAGLGIGVHNPAPIAALVVTPTTLTGTPLAELYYAGAGTLGIASVKYAGGANGLNLCLSPSKSPRMIAVVQPGIANANETTWLLGFFLSASATASGAYLRINTTGSLEFVTRQGGTETATSLGARPAGVTLYEIRTEDAGVTWKVLDSTGAVLASHTTNVPTAADALAFGNVRVLAGAAQPAYLAYMLVEATFS